MIKQDSVYLDPQRKLQESHQLAIDFISRYFDSQSSLLILEVGVGSGAVGRGLREKFPNVLIDAVDKENVYLNESKEYYNQIYYQPIENFDNNKQYDVIVLLDVLEHLENPWQVLSNLKNKNLKKSGIVVISIPNIAHWTIRKNICKGYFKYTKYGILDKTHLRFFTLNTYQDLINSCGLKINEISYTSFIEAIDSYRRFPFTLLPTTIRNAMIHKLTHWYPSVFAVQFVSISQPEEVNL